MINDIISHIDASREDALVRLNELLRIPSISTDPEAKPGIRAAANWIHGFFENCGIESMILETEGHPAVIADTGPVDGDGPTVLIYGHYDVQPTGDPSLWKSEPFAPEVRDGRLYARGSADDKGQVFTHMLAAEAWKKVAGKLPIRVKFLIEGEEEIGSKHLGKILEEQKDRLACDYVCLSDTPKLSEEKPAITYGTKGMVYKEINYTAQTQDLHSGAFGGTFPNPGNALNELIAKMKDADHRVTIEGFYDDVLDSTPEELASLKTLPFDEEEYRNSVGAKALVGEKGFTTLQRRWLRPTLDVNGLLCGFTGEGSMTIIPAKAMAKVSMRLVPNQSAAKISASFDKFVEKHTPAGIDHTIKTFTLCDAYMCPLTNPGLKQAAAAVEAGFGVAPAFTREGGSLPILPLFKKVLGAESLMVGFSLPTCNLHGPNEFMVVDDFYKGIRTSAHLFDKMAN